MERGWLRESNWVAWQVMGVLCGGWLLFFPRACQSLVASRHRLLFAFEAVPLGSLPRDALCQIEEDRHVSNQKQLGLPLPPPYRIFLVFLQEFVFCCVKK